MAESSPRLARTQLVGTTWFFYQEAAPAEATKLRLLHDSGIGLHDHPNERFWQVENGVLCLLDQHRAVSVRFDGMVWDAGGPVLRGAHLPTNTALCLGVQAPLRVPNHQTRTALAARIATAGWTVGAHSYGVPQFIAAGEARFHCGKYCSIAAGVKISLGDHRVDLTTTYPFATLRETWKGAPRGVRDHGSKGDVVIGHDVWIGTDAWIGSGVSIGSGAVIGAKAVVTRSMPPYAVVVGNPARVARHRFSDTSIRALLDLAWWDLPDETVETLLPCLLSTDVDHLISALQQIRSPFDTHEHPLEHGRLGC